MRTVPKSNPSFMNAETIQNKSLQKSFRSGLLVEASSWFPGAYRLKFYEIYTLVPSLMTLQIRNDHLLPGLGTGQFRKVIALFLASIGHWQYMRYLAL